MQYIKNNNTPATMNKKAFSETHPNTRFERRWFNTFNVNSDIVEAGYHNFKLYVPLALDMEKNNKIFEGPRVPEIDYDCLKTSNKLYGVS